MPCIRLEGLSSLHFANLLLASNPLKTQQRIAGAFELFTARQLRQLVFLFSCFSYSFLWAATAHGTLSLEGIEIPVLQGVPVTVETASSVPSILAPFTITLDYSTSPTAPNATELAAFSSAKATWESIITGYKENFPGITLNIKVKLAPNDGPGGILGSAGPSSGFATASYFYANTGQMSFDTADTAALAGSGNLNAVILHEMAHVIGVGTLWSASAATTPPVIGKQELYVNGSGQYTGAFGLAAYNSEFGQVGASVPVELDGGAGTANAHWNENPGGAGLTNIVNGAGKDMTNELMTGWLNSPTFISTLTIQSFQDLGYNVAAIPETSSFALMLVPACVASIAIGMSYRSRRNSSIAPSAAPTESALT